ncbi:MAG: helix-turn-helix domain-containing protein [Oscillospiraceae bacterium]|nr:helix-turn-helix domain-containing protein [Oscillospiraceae bacterium]
MPKEPFETMPDVMDAKQIAEALQLSKAGAYNLLSSPNFPTLRIGGRKLVLKQELIAWLKSQTKTTGREDDQ